MKHRKATKNRNILKGLSLVLGVLASSLGLLHAQVAATTNTPPTPTTTAKSPSPRTPTTASTPVKLPRGTNREGQIMAAAKGHNPQVILIGDSITEYYNKDVWAKNYGKYDGCTYGFSGENTENILAYIDDGVLTGINPKVAILLIGTNNLGHNPTEKPEWVADGIKAIVAAIHQKLPNTKVLVMGIFPRGKQAGDGFRPKVQAVNAIVSKLDNGGDTRFIDIGTKFLLPNGDADKTLLGDWLHPTPQGEQVWADAIQPLLDEMMGNAGSGAASPH